MQKGFAGFYSRGLQGFDGGLHRGCVRLIWEFPKIGGTLFWAPYNKDPTI